MYIHAIILILSSVILGFSTPAWSLPQFDIQFGSVLFPEKGHEVHHQEEQPITYDCRACHINPTGGGMRNAHGRQFSIERLPITEKTDATEKAAGSAQLNEYLSIGTDIRFAYLRTEDEATSRFEDSFFPMQADLYIAFSPTDYLTFYYQDGVEASGSRETFVLFQNLPYNSHIKAGRFTPPYGLKLDDHTTYIREKLGFGADDSFGQDSGLEVGFGGHRLFGNAAIFNGGPFGGPGSADDNNDKGFSATGGWKSSSFWLAGSFYNNENELEAKTYAGGYAAFHFWRLNLLGEWDHFEVDHLIASTENTGSLYFGEIGISLLKGVNAMVRYERCEDDDGSTCIDDDTLDRLTFGFYLYPSPFTEFIIQYRKNSEDTEIDNDRFLAMLHLFY
jgi:hypothetical protein